MLANRQQDRTAPVNYVHRDLQDRGRTASRQPPVHAILAFTLPLTALRVRSQVQRTAAACFAALRQLRDVRRSVPASVYPTLAVTPVLSKLDYGNARWSAFRLTNTTGCSPFQVQPCGRLLDRVVQITSMTRWPPVTAWFLSASSPRWRF